MTKHDFFFHYDLDTSKKTFFSSLSLLRRDINSCFGRNPNNPKLAIDYIALWPGTMAILAGIDLLAKFHAGNDEFDKARPRFINYVERFIDSKYKEELYQLRNSLLHSFGLHSEDKNGKVYKFILTRDTKYLVKPSDMPNEYLVSVSTLLEKFEKSILEFQKTYDSLESNRNFEELFDKYGLIGIWKFND